MIRLFIAFPLSEKVKASLKQIISDLRLYGGDIKWVDFSNIHLTLKFLGDTDPKIIPRITDIIDSTAIKYQAQQVTIDRLGSFPNFDRPRVIWVGSSSDTGTLTSIAEHIDIGTATLGWEREEKKFKPHLTLGRIKNPTRLHELTDAAKTYRFETIEMLLDRIILYQSTLTPHGPIYKKLHETVLG